MPTPRPPRFRSRWMRRFATDASVRASTLCLRPSGAASPGALAYSAGPDSERLMTKFALVFPGQGSQSIGMMAAYETLPAVLATFSEASKILGQELWTLVTEG